jgi:hypothetical protein
MRRFARWLAENPYLVLAASLAITVWLGFYAWQIKIESALDTVLPRGDPAVAYYDEIRSTFGSDDVGVVGVLAPDASDVLAPSTLEKINRLTLELGKLEGVEKVLSLTNTADVAADVFTPPKLLPKIPPSRPRSRRCARSSTPCRSTGRTSSPTTTRGTAINIFFESMPEGSDAATKLDQEIMALLDKEVGPERLFYTGASHVKQQAVELMRRDLYRFTPLALLLVVVTLWLSFRTKRGVIVPLLSGRDGARLDARHHGALRALDLARHVRAAAAAARARQLVRDPRDGAVLRADRGPRPTQRGRRARVRARVGAARHLGHDDGDRLRLAHGEPHPGDLRAGRVRRRRRAVPRR